MNFNSCIAISVIRFFSGWIPTQMNMLFTIFNPNVYGCKPFLSGVVKAHAFITASIVFLSSTVSMILGRRGFSKIFPLVIRFIFIDMVNFIFGPLSSHPHPNNTVRKIVFTLDSDFNAPLIIRPSRYFSDSSPLRKLNCPAQKASTFIIFKKLLNKRCWQVVMRIFRTTHEMVVIDGSYWIVKRPCYGI